MATERKCTIEMTEESIAGSGGTVRERAADGGTPGQQPQGPGSASGQHQPDSGGSAEPDDPAQERDLPDENGEPPSVDEPGNPDASEPPVENF